MLDHVVHATPDLAATVADLRGRGLDLVPGGPHVGLGTRNFLAGLGDGAYLEVIGPDPEQPSPSGLRPFGVDELARATTVAWCLRPASDLDDVVAAVARAGADPGPVRSMSRQRPDGVLLEWRLTSPPVAVVATLPFFIDWRSSPHPTSSMPQHGTLRALTVSAPDDDLLREVLAAAGEHDQRLDVRRGAPSLVARITLPSGAALDL